MSAPIEVHVTVLGHRFGPKEDGYRVIDGMDQSGQKLVLSGKVFPDTLEDGDEMVVTGAWRSTLHGSTLHAETARRMLPRSNDGIRLWLTNSKIPGIGKARAKSLVDLFGENTFARIVSRDPRAAKIIGPKLIGPAAEYLIEKTNEAELGAMLSGYGIGGAVQTKILRKYADKAQQIVLEKPYRLIMDIKGVAFETADKIAKSNGISLDHPERVRAGILEVLRLTINDGNTAIYHDQLVDKVERLLYVDYQLVETQIKELANSHLRKVQLDAGPGWTTLRLDDSEERFARRIVAKIKQAPTFTDQQIHSAIEDAQAEAGKPLNERQLSAVHSALANPVSILTGGPGTGKTVTLEVLTKAWRALAAKNDAIPQKAFKVAAPTGRAAKRASETTGLEGRTIHRLLEFDPASSGFERNAANPIEAGFIAVDESSMPDVHIMRDLANAWGDAHILFVGDVDQLPSVGPGAILRDLIDCGQIPVTRLDHVYRQAEGSQIALGAAEVREGRMPEMAAPGKGDLVFIEIEKVEDIAARVREIYTQTMPAYLTKRGLDPSSIQILSPGKQSAVGTIALNIAVQGHRESNSTVRLTDQMTARSGDPVIQLENNYELDIYNGDVGRILEITPGESESETTTYVDFGGRVLTFKGAALTNLSLAYALTIHKSQGSEYQVVIIPVSDAHYSLNRRPLIYTGMTRAKKICVFVGQRRALRRALERDDANTRITTLKNRIIQKCA